MVRNSAFMVLVITLVGFTHVNKANSSESLLEGIAVTIEDLKNAPEYERSPEIPPDVRHLLSQLKHQLRDALVETINHVPLQHQAPDQLRATFVERLEAHGMKLGSCEGPPSLNIFGGYPATGDCEYGVIDEITIEQPEAHTDLLAVTTTLGIPCGRDSSLYILKKQTTGWQLVFALEANDYADIDGALGSFGYAVSPPDKNGKFFIVAAHINPWCSSNWQGITLQVFRLGADAYQPTLLMDREGSIWLGVGLPFYTLTVDTDSFMVSFVAESLDGGIHNREYIWNYTVSDNTVNRVTPIARLPRVFLEEWIALPWDEASQWVASSFTEGQRWHTTLREALDKDYGEFSFVQPCEQDRWQIGLLLALPQSAREFLKEMPDEVFFTVVKKQDAYYMQRIDTVRPPGCPGETHPAGK